MGSAGQPRGPLARLSLNNLSNTPSKARTPGKTPLSVHTPQGVLTPNNDDKERQQQRERRASQRARALQEEDGSSAAAAAVRNTESQWQQSQQQGSGDVPPAARTAAASAGLNNFQILDLYKNCLKLASENKITQKNTWDLPLIDHLSDLVKPSHEEGEQTNFQRASCTLDAGVKIYSSRVDSAHSDAFKVLGGLSRSAAPILEEEPEEGEEGGLLESLEGGGGRLRRKAHADADPSSTLESSFEALNLKKFDLAFTVDPLFHKTSAQFDEGGARGLLLNNLSVFRGCEIVFDSSDIPDQGLDEPAEEAADVQVDLSALQAQLQALTDAPPSTQISPALNGIYELLGRVQSNDAAQAADDLVRQAVGLATMRPDADAAVDTTGGGVASSYGAAAYPELHADAISDGEADAGGFGDDGDDNDTYMGGVDDGGANEGPEDDPTADAPGDWLAQEEAPPANESSLAHAAAATEQHSLQASQGALGPEALQWLLGAGSEEGQQRGGPVTRGAAWAGAAHWKYRTAAAEQPAESKPKRAARKKKDYAALDFESLPALLDAAKKALQRGAAKDTVLRKRNTKAPPDAELLLPEDHHYQAAYLAQYFLKPNVLPGGAPTAGGDAAGAEAAAEFSHSGGDADGGDYNGGGDSDNDDNGGGGWDADEAGASDFGEGAGGEELLEVPRHVEKLSITYAKASKQVDVRALKETLWAGIQRLSSDPAEEAAEQPAAPLSLHAVLAAVPERNAAGRLEDLSVHLCFICLLHLANEHGLVVRGVPGLDELTVSGVERAYY